MLLIPDEFYIEDLPGRRIVFWDDRDRLECGCVLETAAFWNPLPLGGIYTLFLVETSCGKQHHITIGQFLGFMTDEKEGEEECNHV